MSPAARRREVAAQRAADMAEEHRRRHARGENALGHTPDMQRQMGLQRLERVREMICTAYHREAHRVRTTGRPEDLAKLGEAQSLTGALQWIYDDEERIAPTYASRLLSPVLRAEPVATWEAHPLVTQLDVLRVLDAAIILAGGTPSRRRPRRSQRRGGWQISSPSMAAGGAR